MSYSIRILDKSDNLALLELSKSRNTGSTLFNTERGTDFFALSEELGQSTYFGILKNEQLIGAVGVARQMRMINGSPVPAFYIFDLKVHPDWSGKPPYYRLMHHVVAHCRDVEKAGWVFATILDTNENTGSLTKGAQLFPKATLIGKNHHIGFPVFFPQKIRNRQITVKEIPAEDAWKFYLEHTKSKSFAPADKAVFFKENGFFLGCFSLNSMVAVTKIIDQSPARNIYLTQQPPFYFRILNLLCRYYGCPALPKQNQEFHHGYLSYYAASKNEDYRKAFINYIQKKHPGKFSYLFTGMTEKEASHYRNPFLIKFTSSSYGYGALPPVLSLDVVELTLI